MSALKQKPKALYCSATSAQFERLLRGEVDWVMVALKSSCSPARLNQFYPVERPVVVFEERFSKPRTLLAKVAGAVPVTALRLLSPYNEEFRRLFYEAFDRPKGALQRRGETPMFSAIITLKHIREEPS